VWQTLLRVDGKTNERQGAVFLAFVDGNNGGFVRTSAEDPEKLQQAVVLWKAVRGESV
jgi:hypothetical protein